MSAKLVTLIEVYDRRGLGVEHDPVRLVRQWWTLDGMLVVEAPDPYAQCKSASRSASCSVEEEHKG